MILPGDCHQRIHVGGLAIEVDGHQGLDPATGGSMHQMPILHRTAVVNEALNGGWSQVEGVRVDVAEDRPSARPGNGPCCCEKGKGRSDNLVPRADFERHQGEQQGIGAGGDPDAFRGAAITGNLLLQRTYVLAHYEVLASAYLINYG